MVALEMRWYFFVETFVWMLEKKNMVMAPSGMKNTKNWRDTFLQVNFALFNM